MAEHEAASAAFSRIPVEVACETAHLVFEVGETPDVTDPALLIERGNRLGARHLPAGGVNSAD